MELKTFMLISGCVRVKGGESEWFRIDSGVRQGCIMSPYLFNVYIDGVIHGEDRTPLAPTTVSVRWQII